MSREKIYAKFLTEHLPKKCGVSYGGFIFDDSGLESKQLDILITSDVSLRFDFHNEGNAGKTFSHIEGVLGVTSVKSTLDKKELFDALGGFSSIPETGSLEKRILPFIKIPNYEDWPVKILYASDGVKYETLLKHINSFYDENSDIPLYRRPNYIHVAGKYFNILS